MRVAFIQKKKFEKISIHYLAGALKAHGIEYDIFIEELEPDFYGQVRKYNPSYVIYSLFIGEENFAFAYFRKIKALLPGVTTLVGGPFALIFPDIIQRPEIDFLFQGDGEESLPKFIEYRETGKSVKEIDGIHFVDKNNKTYQNPHRRLVDVNTVPRPDRDVYYKYESLQRSPTKIFIGSRGCPYGCTYCYNRELSQFYPSTYWRQRKIEDIIEEIDYVKSRYGLSWVHFQDGTFNADTKWLQRFLKAYSRSDLPPFLINARIENIDEPTIRLLKEAGCNRITFGIQSGNDRIRCQLAGRHMSAQQIIKACGLCKKYGIRVGVDIIFGWPGETLQNAMDTIRLCRAVEADTYSSNVLIFWPKVRITQYAYENGYIAKLPTFQEIDRLTPNTSLLSDSKKTILINLDKLFFYFIKFPKFEKPLMTLLRLPPNRLFNLLKNLHLLIRCIKYDTNDPALKTVLHYISSHWKTAIGRP